MTARHTTERRDAPPPGVETAARRLVDEVLSGQGLVAEPMGTRFTAVDRRQFGRFDASAEISAGCATIKVRLGVFYDLCAAEAIAAAPGSSFQGGPRQNVHDLFGETANQLVGRVAALVENGDRLALSQPMTVFWGEDDFAKALAPGRAGAFVQLWRIDNRAAGLRAGLQLAIRGDDGVLDRLARSPSAPAPKAGVLEFF